MISPTDNFCAQQVREYDPDRYLLSMFAPADRREGLWALFAFNIEIAKTREVVSETQLGLIRLQWWREAITEMYDSGIALEHGVLQALARAIEVYELPQEHFEKLIFAREFDLEDVLPENIEGLIKYADFTNTPLMKLAVQVAGDDPDAEPVQPVSVNYALAGIVRSVPHFARQRRCLLPEDLLKQHEQRLDKLYELKPSEGLPHVVEAVTGHIVRGMRCENRFLRKAQKLAEIYAKQVQAVKYDVFSPKMGREPVLKVLRVMV